MPTNPFSDPAGPDPTPPSPDHPPQEEEEPPSVLPLARNATLTLATDALILLDESLRHTRPTTTCCGLSLPGRAKTTLSIPFHHVLWAELQDLDVVVHYVTVQKGAKARPTCLQYSLPDKSSCAYAEAWTARLMARAYPGSTQRGKRVKVLINPFGGQGQAEKLWTREVAPILAAARCKVDVQRTSHRGHAEEIARELDVEKYDVVACASGDGLPHEVFNGLAKRKDARRALGKVAVTQLPCGSGNAMSLNLNGTASASLAAVAVVKGKRTKMDLVAITQGEERYFSFLSQAVGIIAETDLGTEGLRWMGPARFTWGVFVRLVGREQYPAEVSVALDTADKEGIKKGYWDAVREEATRSSSERLRDSASSSSSSDDNDTPFPNLKYGTISSPLPPDFHTTDHPDLGNFYAGKMCWMTADAPFFPTSLPADGKMDLITISALIPRLTGLRMLATSSDGSIIDFPEVEYRKVRAYRITPRARPVGEAGRRGRLGRWLGGGEKGTSGGLISVDGERVPWAPFQAEVVPGMGTVLSRNGGVYEWGGPPSGKK